MYKCQTCGTEFDGKFCPECGTPAPSDVCPNCGAPLSHGQKFCSVCGTPVGAFPPGSKEAPKPAEAPDPVKEEPAPAPKKPRSTGSPIVMKVCALLPYVPSLLFALFSVLLFLMFLGSVATTFGMGLGNIYNFVSLAQKADGNSLAEFAAEGETAPEGMVLAVRVCIGLIVCAVLGILLAAAAATFRCYVPLRVKKVGTVRICTLLDVGICAFYLIDLLLCCILCGAVSDPITSPGSGTVCVLVFSLLFGLCTAAALLLQKFSARIFPVETAEAERIKAEYRAETEPPVPPEKKPVKPQGPQYNFEECTTELQTEIEKNARARNLIIIFSAVIFMLLRCLRQCILPSFEEIFLSETESVGELLGMGYFTPNQLLPSSWLMWPASVRSRSMAYSLWGIYALLIVILGCIFGKKYDRKPHSERFDWRGKKTWSKLWSVWTVSFAFVSFFLVAFSAAAIICKAKIPHYLPEWGMIETEINFGDATVITAYVYAAMCLVYIIVFAVLWSKNARKRKELSRAICGADFPWKVHALQEQCLEDEKRYHAERQAYLDERSVWRAYYRALAYYEEGIPYKT